MIAEGSGGMRAVEGGGVTSAVLLVVQVPGMVPALTTGPVGNVASAVGGVGHLLQGREDQAAATATRDVIAGTATAPATLTSSRSQTQRSCPRGLG
ncbi:hypothetical protein E2C01_100949 [Portunus trituberculatus]|uniref:Uncharacterized protein n=1 Tax=Portunus trituberculatus TaxID=210409 RepID=A0A5B7KIU1_PORTR|nr:hypothetical protein [Portunus trituberculatus]